jgi:hypothetical protein
MTVEVQTVPIMTVDSAAETVAIEVLNGRTVVVIVVWLVIVSCGVTVTMTTDLDCEDVVGCGVRVVELPFDCDVERVL